MRLIMLHYITLHVTDMIGQLDDFLFEGKRFIVLDVTERWFRFNFL
jgi:hypothetical protein